MNTRNSNGNANKSHGGCDRKISALLERMSTTEKIGQMCQVNVGEDHIRDDLAESVRVGHVGSVLNIVNLELVNELQRIAREESPNGIPLLVGRDVIHGFHTVMPIPLGQAASWNPDGVREAAAIAAREAACAGVNWTFAPMIDIARDPRWGRIAESLGEDPYLASILGVAMVQGFQGDDLAAPDKIAACAKHFVGYGAVESGRDYATTNIPENELRNVYLRPFRAAVDAGVATLMTSFSDLDGIPASANRKILRDILRDEWGFEGFVISDWDSVRQLSIHGLTADDKEAAYEAATAGVDMEMHGDAYRNHLQSLIDAGKLSINVVDRAVASILRTKFALGLFENPYTDPGRLPPSADLPALDVARRVATESVVLLKNDAELLPLTARNLQSLAVIGPLADTPREQLGTWIFDGDPMLSTTPLQALRERGGKSFEIHYVQGLTTSRSRDTTMFDEAVRIAGQADVVIAFVGEEAILSGEAHCRADIHLPGAQPALLRKLRATGKQVVAVVVAGRPLVLTDIMDYVDAILFAPHPGTMAGPAIIDLLFGDAVPVGKLPTTLPRMVGQIPIYYAQKNTGKPATSEPLVLIDDIDANAEQLSIGMTSYHLDAGHEPLFPFGFGLSYTTFEYSELRCDTPEIELGGTVTVRARLTNTGERAATEVAQLYIRDLVGSVTRPVRELRGFQRVHLQPAESVQVVFQLHTDELGFYGRKQTFAVEPGEFHAWVGGNAAASMQTHFCITEPKKGSLG